MAYFTPDVIAREQLSADTSAEIVIPTGGGVAVRRPRLLEPEPPLPLELLRALRDYLEAKTR